jgi:hypothetical protein
MRTELNYYWLDDVEIIIIIIIIILLLLLSSSLLLWVERCSKWYEESGCRCWRKVAMDTDAWKLILKQARSCVDRRASGEEES